MKTARIAIDTPEVPIAEWLVDRLSTEADDDDSNFAVPGFDGKFLHIQVDDETIRTVLFALENVLESKARHSEVTHQFAHAGARLSRRIRDSI